MLGDFKFEERRGQAVLMKALLYRPKQATESYLRAE